MKVNALVEQIAEIVKPIAEELNYDIYHIEYVKVTRPKFGTEAFYAMIEFAKYVKENIGDVAFSVVNVINDEQIERCKSLADEMGIPLRVREKEE